FFIGVSPFFVVIERIRHLIQLLKTQHLAKTRENRSVSIIMVPLLVLSGRAWLLSATPPGCSQALVMNNVWRRRNSFQFS
ncbi:MAG: hypothetical protein SGJ27_22185, partial [Candidatus Melainabacteria bacterium]|nr:hypothetical protein [Candidatus Melainabacteria bacterium]